MSVDAGTKLGRYEIRSLLGKGGMGEIYLAQDTELEHTVALKILPADVASSEQRMQRFIREAKTASALNHPNILTIHEIGTSPTVREGSPASVGTHFIATEFIDGETLRQRMKSAGMKMSEVLNVAIQTADALSAAHEAGIIHRDIKPENIMLRRRDSIVKVLDFGLAKLTERLPPESVDTEAPTSLKTDPGTVLGTAFYMSPEQARGIAVDARSDIWSLGVVLYEMVAGCLPFKDSTASGTVAAILNEKEAPPLARFARDVPAELERIVEKALRKDREERYQVVKDLLLDLKRLKQRLEIDAEIDRTAAPEKSDAPTHEPRVSPVSEYDKLKFIEQPSESDKLKFVEQRDTPSTHVSSAEYLVNQVKLHQRSAFVVLGVVALAAIIALFWYFRQSRAAPLTDKDTILLADFDNTTGDAAFDGTLKQALAIQLEQSPGLAFIRLNRFDEAKEIYERALAQGLPFHAALYWIAFLHGDQAAMRQQIDQMKGRPEEHVVPHLQATTAGFYGQLRQHREFSNRSVDLALRRNLRELAAAYASGDALRHAVVGDCRQIREDTAKALTIARTDISLMHNGTALALCGELGQAQALTDELLRRNPKDTLVNDVWVPALQAAIEIHRGNPAKVIQLLQSASRYEAATFSWPAYLRGLAYLQQRTGTEAMAEFQKILDNRGWDIPNILYPLSQLGLARAAALVGDTAKSRKAYEDLFALWKDADPDIPILMEAKKEYAKLQ